MIDGLLLDRAAASPASLGSVWLWAGRRARTKLMLLLLPPPPRLTAGVDETHTQKKA